MKKQLFYLFLLLLMMNLLDIHLTTYILQNMDTTGIGMESNPVAEHLFKKWDILGFVFLKTLSMSIVIAMTSTIAFLDRAKTAYRVMQFAVVTNCLMVFFGIATIGMYKTTTPQWSPNSRLTQLDKK